MKNNGILLVLFFTTVMVNAQELQSYLEEAEANNPEIQAYELRYNIANEKVGAANALPNTTVSAGYFVSEPETRTGAQRAKFSISQMLPWFGTITARENYANSMAEADYLELAIAKRKLALTVAQSYYELYAIEAKKSILQANIQLLGTYEQLALTSVEVGKASVVDVLKLQIRQNELQQQYAILNQEFLAERARFNTLRNQKESLSVALVSELELPLEDPVLSNENLELNPELLKYDKMFESVTQSEVLNQRESLPSIGVGLDYVPVSERTDMSFSDNGKDIVMPMLSFSIPIFNSSYRSISKQNELKQMEIKSQKKQRLNILETALAQAVSLRNQARIANATQQMNLQHSKDAEEILLKNYETGTIDFKEVLDIQELQLKFQINQIESIKLYYKQSTNINYLIQ
ncbi:TolC family protein [Maribacter sp. CXY002]|uniref:TolC family protein n=1 Tax=Maribacter luteocoastalis TaxID=3407671 RepID=UPI003B67D1D7